MPGFINSKGFKMLLIILFIFAAYKFYVNYRQIQQLNQHIVQLQDNISLAEEKKLSLQEELKNINDPEYIEKIAREELGLVKPGELLLIPVEEDK